MERSALVLIHPFERFGADEDEIEEFLGGQDEYDDVYYVGRRDGWTPPHVQTFREDVNRRSELPPGFDRGVYSRGLTEVRGGTLTDEEMRYLLERYEVLGVGGAQEGGCEEKGRQDLERFRSENGFMDTEIRREERVVYS